MVTTTESWVGQRVANERYEVKAILGEGGMGCVYRALDHRLRCDVVIKVPRATALADPEFVQRFRQEITALVQLSHPHIVKVSDVGQHDGFPFAVMQYLPGGSLDEKKAGLNRLPCPTEILGCLQPWLLPVAEALDYIHGRNFIHRDIKPANILFDATGNAFISDFGVAKVVREKNPAKRGVTQVGQVLGTPEYMAPEIIMGRPFDGRADQYALAVTVYEVLSGKPPFTGPTPESVLVHQTTGTIPSLAKILPEMPKALIAAIERGLAKEPTERFPDCLSFAREVLAGVTSTVPSASLVGMTALDCPKCGKVLRVPTSAAGRRVLCPVCRTVIEGAESPAQTRMRSKSPSAETGKFEQSKKDTDPAPPSRISLSAFPSHTQKGYARLDHAPQEPSEPPRRPRRKRRPLPTKRAWVAIACLAILFVGMIALGAWLTGRPTGGTVAARTLKLEPTLTTLTLEPGKASQLRFRVDRGDYDGALSVRVADQDRRLISKTAKLKAGKNSGSVEVTAHADAQFDPGERVSSMLVALDDKDVERSRVIIEIRIKLEFPGKTADPAKEPTTPKPDTPVADALTLGSVWSGTGKYTVGPNKGHPFKMTLRITERNGKDFKAIMLIDDTLAQYEHAEEGTVDGRTVQWKTAKMIKPVGPGKLETHGKSCEAEIIDAKTLKGRFSHHIETGHGGGEFELSLAGTERAPNDGQEPIGTWEADNQEYNYKEIWTIKKENDQWSLTCDFKRDAKVIGSFIGKDIQFSQGVLRLKAVYIKKPVPSFLEGDLALRVEKEQLCVTWNFGNTHPEVSLRLSPSPKPSPSVPPKSSFFRTAQRGGDAGNEFLNMQTPTLFLSGFKVTTRDFPGPTVIICSLRPIYLSGGRYVDDPVVYGRPNGKETVVGNRPGYAVAGMRVRWGTRVDGFSLILMRIKGEALDPTDQVESAWVGGQRGSGPKQLGGDGTPVVGVFGRYGTDLDAVGLIQYRQPGPGDAVGSELLGEWKTDVPDGTISQRWTIGNQGGQWSVECVYLDDTGTRIGSFSGQDFKYDLGCLYFGQKDVQKPNEGYVEGRFVAYVIDDNLFYKHLPLVNGKPVDGHVHKARFSRLR